MNCEETESISTQLMASVQAAIGCGWSIYALANAASVPHSGLQMWVSGTRQGMKLDTAAKLAAFFNQKLTKPNIPKPPASVMPQKGPAKKKASTKKKTKAPARAKEPTGTKKTGSKPAKKKRKS